MKIVVLALLVAAMATPALAQNAPPPVNPSGPDTAPPAAGGAPGNAKEVRMQCRAEVQGQGLTGAARARAVSDCVVKARPDLAAHEQCRRDGLAKGLRQQDLHAYVKDCVTKG